MKSWPVSMLRRRWLTTCLLSGALASGGGSASAQKAAKPVAKAAEPVDSQEGAEAELPDFDALERGVAAPSSTSFRHAPPVFPPKSTSLSSGKDTAEEEAGARQIEGAAVGLIPPGGLFGVDSSTMSTVSGGGDDGPAAAVPEFHVVKKGDTLWSLCEGYFRDAWRWPRLWAQNPLITNPHWIFPGDVVRLHGAGAPASVAAAASPAAKLITSTRQGSLGSTALVLREIGFVEANDLSVSARITGSREEKIMLSSGDQAYLSFAKGRPLHAGERYSVFVADTENPVREPGTGTILGYLVRIYGDILVDQIANGQSARGTLLDLMDPVERGYLVSPLIRQFRRIEPRPSPVNLQTRIVAAFSAQRLLAPETFVVLGRGKKDGVQVGNRSFIIRRGDGYRRLMESWEKNDPHYPNEVVGELWIVEVRENTSLAWIARSTKEIRVGETAEMRKGH